MLRNKAMFVTMMAAQQASPSYQIDLSTLPDGALPAQFTGATWAIASGKLINTPTLGSNLLVNGDMETGNPPTGWDNDSSTILTGDADVRPGSAGVQSLKAVYNTDRTFYKIFSVSAIGWHRQDSWVKNISADFITRILGTAAAGALRSGNYGALSATEWTSYANCDLFPTENGFTVRFDVNSHLNDAALFDDITIKKISDNTLFSTVNIGLSSVNISAPSAGSSTIPHGIVLCVDNPANPTQYVAAFIDYGMAFIYQVKAGVYTALLGATALTMDAAKHFSAQLNGTTLSLYYGATDFGTKIGTDVTVDAAVALNKNHGLFSTISSNQFSGIFRVSKYSPFSPVATSTPLNVVYGGTSITNAVGGFRDMTAAWMAGTYGLTTFVVTNSSASGRTSWNNLFRIQADFLDKTPDLIFFENANDGAGGFCRRNVEAFIRRIWTDYPDCKIIFTEVFAVADRTDNNAINTPTTSANQVEFSAVASHYGIPMLHYWDRIASLVNTYGRNLSDFLIDTVHPSNAGHAEILKLAEPVLTASYLSNPQRSGALPTRLYDNGDYEQAATVKNGTGYDSKTGTWAEDGTSISSSEAGATVTFSGTFISIGRPESDGVVQLSFDGGAYRTFTFGPNGASHADIDTRAAHTATIKVISGTVTISQFWAI